MTKIEALELELAARKLVEGTKLNWWNAIRYYETGCPRKAHNFHNAPCLECSRERYELAVAIVEDKPVFIGDQLYSGNGNEFIVHGFDPCREEFDGFPAFLDISNNWHQLSMCSVTHQGLFEDRIDKMVTRFLNWKLPKDFSPDAGISFEPTKPYEGDELGNSWWPIGTNLFTAEQARDMIRYLMKEP